MPIVVRKSNKWCNVPETGKQSRSAVLFKTHRFELEKKQ